MIQIGIISEYHILVPNFFLHDSLSITIYAMQINWNKTERDFHLVVILHCLVTTVCMRLYPYS